MKEKLFSWLNRSLDRDTTIGIAAYADTINAVCLKKIKASGLFTALTV